jgi:aspartyl-tRNA(Asn)/glutamyl-tRNA(Gln) amidotransferase subunit C
MPALTRKDVEEIALLARLHLEPDELDRIQHELAELLGHFEVIAAVDTDGVPPMTHAVQLELRLRRDTVEPSLAPELALAGAARRDGDLILVPSSITPGRPPREPGS